MKYLLAEIGYRGRLWVVTLASRWSRKARPTNIAGEPQPSCSHQTRFSPRRLTSSSARLLFTPIQSNFFHRDQFYIVHLDLTTPLCLSLGLYLFVCVFKPHPHTRSEPTEKHQNMKKIFFSTSEWLRVSLHRMHIAVTLLRLRSGFVPTEFFALQTNTSTAHHEQHNPPTPANKQRRLQQANRLITAFSPGKYSIDEAQFTKAKMSKTTVEQWKRRYKKGS